MGSYDPLHLRPPTVEELAAQERAESVPARHRRHGRRTLLIVVSTVALLAAGAGAFALARSDSEPELVQPYGSDAPFGVGHVDGFGEHSPKPSSSAATTSSKPKPRASIVDTRRADTDATAKVRLGAVHWSTVFNGGYDTYVWVRNEGTQASGWEVRITLPSGASVARTMAVNHIESGGTHVFTTARGDLPPGQVYLFGFSGAAGSGKFSIRSCAVNGSPCVPFR